MATQIVQNRNEIFNNIVNKFYQCNLYTITSFQFRERLLYSLFICSISIFMRNFIKNFMLQQYLNIERFLGIYLTRIFCQGCLTLTNTIMASLQHCQKYTLCSNIHVNFKLCKIYINESLDMLLSSRGDWQENLVIREYEISIENEAAAEMQNEHFSLYFAC